MELSVKARRAILGAVAALTIVAGPGYAAGDPEGLFRQGNAAFRAGDYDKALSKYRAARAAGMDSALLHYNTGIANYRRGNYLQAEVALRKATTSPKLAAVTYYNLGLTSKAMGERERARRWFERAWDASESQPKIRELSTKALARINRRTGDAAIVRAPSGDEALFRFTAVARVGYDDNVFRSPSTSYVDLAQAGQPVMDPMVQSGMFFPINLKAEYAFEADSRTDLSFAYLFDGDFYTDSTLENANEINQRLRFKGRTLLGAPKGRRWKAFSTKFEARRQDDTNFDPDDGVERDVGGEDLSDRFSYSSVGLDTLFEHRLGRVGWGLLAAAELRDYEPVENVSSYDHEFYLAGGFVRFPVLPRTILKLGYKYYIRDYSDRLTRDINGDLVTGNPELEYRYQSMEAQLTHRLSRMFSVLLAYRYMRRDDMFFGYDDYTQDRIRMRMVFRPTKRFRTDIAVSHRIYDYPNAFAFNDPAGGMRELEDTKGTLVSTYRLNNRLSLWAEVVYRSVTATDTRSEYDRLRTMLGVRWERK